MTNERYLEEERPVQKYRRRFPANISRGSCSPSALIAATRAAPAPLHRGTVLCRAGKRVVGWFYRLFCCRRPGGTFKGADSLLSSIVPRRKTTVGTCHVRLRLGCFPVGFSRTRAPCPALEQVCRGLLSNGIPPYRPQKVRPKSARFVVCVWFDPPAVVAQEKVAVVGERPGKAAGRRPAAVTRRRRREVARKSARRARSERESPGRLQPPTSYLLCPARRHPLQRAQVARAPAISGGLLRLRLLHLFR